MIFTTQGSSVQLSTSFPSSLNTTIIYPQLEFLFLAISWILVLFLESNYGHYNFYLLFEVNSSTVFAQMAFDAFISFVKTDSNLVNCVHAWSVNVIITKVFRPSNGFNVLIAFMNTDTFHSIVISFNISWFQLKVKKTMKSLQKYVFSW